MPFKVVSFFSADYKSVASKSGISVASAESEEMVSSSLVVLTSPEVNGLKFEELLRSPAELLGRGKNGSVYKVICVDQGLNLAVKRIKDWTMAHDHFKQRMKRLDQVRHPNVLPPIAFYCSKQEKLIVYEILTQWKSLQASPWMIKVWMFLKAHTSYILETVEWIAICELELDEAKVKQFKDAIENSYWFEFFMGDLPLWGFVGELHPDRNSDNNKHVLYIYTHKNIIVQYNKDQIIHVILTQENLKPLEAGRTLEMTYYVKWDPTNITFAHRFDVYLDYPFFEHQIRWFSISNSFMMVIFLAGRVSMTNS